MSQNSASAIQKIQDYNDFKSLETVILKQMSHNQDSISYQIYKGIELSNKGQGLADSVLSAQSGTKEVENEIQNNFFQIKVKK